MRQNKMKIVEKVDIKQTGKNKQKFSPSGEYHRKLDMMRYTLENLIEEVDKLMKQSSDGFVIGKDGYIFKDALDFSGKKIEL